MKSFLFDYCKFHVIVVHYISSYIYIMYEFVLFLLSIRNINGTYSVTKKRNTEDPKFTLFRQSREPMIVSRRGKCMSILENCLMPAITEVLMLIIIIRKRN